MKKFLFLLFYFFTIIEVKAVYISEIMYDPTGSDTGREWIEIYNDTGGSINFTTWKFFESNTNHSLSSYSSTTSVLPSEYAIIADNPSKFLLDYPNFSGVLYDSSFSLSNSGELIILKDASLNQIDSISYSTSLGGNDDGSTLSFATSSFVRGKATPGSLNIEELKSVSVISGVSVYPTTTVSPSSDIILLVPEQINALSGADKEFSVKAVSGNSGKSIEGLSYTWSFGDGGTKVGKTVNYHYLYPGNYTVIVKAENESYIEKAKIKVRVTDPDMEIISIGNDIRGAYIDIKNKTGSEVDLSNWIIDINSSFYVIPENTFLLNGLTRLSGRALNFSTNTTESIYKSSSSTVRLLYPDNSLFIVYKSENIKEKQTQDFSLINVATTTPKKSIKNKLVNKTETDLNIYKNVKNETKEITENQIKEKPQKDTRIAVYLKNKYRELFGR